MKKITILSSNLGYGGIEKYISSFCKMLEKDYIINIICVYKVSKKPAFSFSNKINIKYLIDDIPRGKSLKKYLISFNLISFFKEIVHRFRLKNLEHRLLKEELVDLKTDYLITTRISHNMMVDKYFNKNNTVLIATEHNYHQKKKKYISSLKKSIIKFDYLIVPTMELYNDYKNIMKPKCVYIPNHLEKLPSVRSKINTKNIISVGRFSKEKGFLDLLDVLKIINDKDKTIKLYLLGDGYLNNKIRNKVSELNLNEYVVMPGFINDQSKYYLDSSIYVMTSFTEAFGLVLIESMSYGVPCVAFDTASGARELLKNNGILIKDRDKEKMANEIISLINNKDRLIKLQKKINISTFEEKSVKYEWEKILID